MKYVLYKKAWVVESHPHLCSQLKKKDVREYLQRGGLLLRNDYNWDKNEQTSFWYLIKDSFGDYDELPSKVRNQVKKSMKVYDIRKVAKNEMKEMGLELFNKSRERFSGGSNLIISNTQWNNWLDLEGLDYWLAIERETGKPFAFAINKIYDDYCDYESMGVSPDAPKSTYPLYGLIFIMNKYYLENLKLKYVMDGSRSITEHSGIQPFLEDKFKFRKAFCDLNVYYRPIIGLLIKSLFPFRRFIKNKKLMAVLRLEAMARGLY